MSGTTGIGVIEREPTLPEFPGDAGTEANKVRGWRPAKSG